MIRLLTGGAKAEASQIHMCVHMSEDPKDCLDVALGADVRVGNLLEFLSASTEHTAKVLYLSAVAAGAEELPADWIVADSVLPGVTPAALWLRVQQKWEGPVAEAAEKAGHGRQLLRTPSGSYVVRGAYDGTDESGNPKRRLSHGVVSRLFGRWSDWDNEAIKDALLANGVQRASVEGERLHVARLTDRLQLVMLAQQVFDEEDPMPEKPVRSSYVVRKGSEDHGAAVALHGAGGAARRRLSHAEVSLHYGADEYEHRALEVEVGTAGKAIAVRRGSSSSTATGGGGGASPAKAKRCSFVVRDDDGKGETESLFQAPKKGLTHAEISLLHGSDEYSHRVVTIEPSPSAVAEGGDTEGGEGGA